MSLIEASLMELPVRSTLGSVLPSNNHLSTRAQLFWVVPPHLLLLLAVVGVSMDLGRAPDRWWRDESPNQTRVGVNRLPLTVIQWWTQLLPVANLSSNYTGAWRTRAGWRVLRRFRHHRLECGDLHDVPTGGRRHKALPDGLPRVKDPRNRP